MGLDEEARTKASEVHKRLLAGEPFPRMAADASDASSKANGGLLGEIPWADISPELQQELQALKVGEFTRVLRTPRGYQILKVEGRIDGTVKPLAEAREAVSEKVFETKRQAEFGRYLERLRGAGHHRVEERRSEEGLRRRYQGAGRRCGQDRAAVTVASGRLAVISSTQCRPAAAHSR